MKLLVIVQHIGRTAPGKVFESLVKELSKMAEVDILTCYYEPVEKIPEIKDITIIKEPKCVNARLTSYANRTFNYMFGISWRDYILGIKAPKLKKSYNALVVFGSSDNLAPLQIGRRYYKSYNIPVYTYLVDACPTPLWWNPAFGVRGIARFIRRVTKGLYAFAASNPMMLAYQRQFIDANIKHLDVLYTATSFSDIVNSCKTEDINFIYTGSLYGLRNPCYLFDAFEKFIKEYPHAKLIFVGTNSSLMSLVPASIKSNIEIKPFTTKLNIYYEIATALIDIDADVDNDVFLSSKITNYIFVDRPIISETGLGSPARNLLDNCPSIFVCGHNANDLFQAMKKCIINRFDYKDREILKKLFSPSHNAQKIMDSLKSIQSTRNT